jgi:hypothetical protein
MPPPRLLPRVAKAFLLGAALSAGLGAGGLVALADPPPPKAFSPDPPPHAARAHWVFDIAVRRGKASIEKTRAVTLAKATETRRTTGRFALELRIGHELLDRARFNVPLMGDEPPIRSKRRPFRAPSLDDVTTRVSAQIADHPRATTLLLVDRITGEEQRFLWPPEADGRLLPWTSGVVAEAGPDDFPEGGAKVLERKGALDGGVSDGAPLPPIDAARADAAHH